ATDKAKGNMQVLQPSIKSHKIKIVSQRFNQSWSPDLAQKQVENALTANKNNVVAVLPSNDGMAYGAIQALKGQGLTGKVFVTGEDAEIPALKQIKAGELSVSSFTPFNDMGTEAARASAAVLAKKPVDAHKTLTIQGKKIPWVQIRAFNV